jgi:hypothetical protein
MPCAEILGPSAARSSRRSQPPPGHPEQTPPAQQGTGQRPPGPAGAVEHAMEAGEIRPVAPSERRQHGGYGAPSRSQNGAGRQNQDALPGRFGEEGGACQYLRIGGTGSIDGLQLFRASCDAPPRATRSTVNVQADRSPASSRPARTARSACWPGTARNGAPADRSASPP